MTTDPQPRRLGLRGEYEASARLETIPAPPAQVASLFPLLETAQDTEDRVLLREACRRMVELLSFSYCVPPPDLKLLGPRPHDTFEGKLSYELFGDYDLAKARIRLWSRTAINKRPASSRTLLSTLCHEFMHHLDVTLLGFPNTFHTTGFFERTHRLYQAATGQPYYPLAWRPADRSGSRTIDWSEMNRRKARAGFR